MNGPSTTPEQVRGGPPPHGCAAGRFGERAAELSGIAARQLGWRPDEFWDATPCEMAAALHEPAGFEPVASDELGALMARFPDERK